MSQVQLYSDGIQTMKTVVLKALSQSRKSRVNFWMFREFAIDAYRYLNLHAIRDGREWKKLTPVMNTVSFPADFEDLVGIYKPIDGQFYPLTRNDSIVITTSLSGIYEVQDATQGEGVAIPNNTSNSPSTPGGVNLQGYYTLDWNGRRVFLSGVTGDIVMLYKASGTRIGDTTFVPNKYIPYLIAFILYEHTKYDDSYPLSRRQELLSTLQIERMDVAKLESPTLDEYLDAIRSTYYGTARR
jgi:hypothetical protein